MDFKDDYQIHNIQSLTKTQHYHLKAETKATIYAVTYDRSCMFPSCGTRCRPYALYPLFYALIACSDRRIGCIRTRCSGGTKSFFMGRFRINRRPDTLKDPHA